MYIFNLLLSEIVQIYLSGMSIYYYLFFSCFNIFQSVCLYLSLNVRFSFVWFQGGNIIEEADLQEIGIHNAADRQKLCSAAQNLPSIKPLTAYKETENFPKNVDEWLNSINLQEYSENFSNNNITDMNRALKLWEVELNTVSFI